MGRYGDLNYPLLAKRGFALGVAMFIIGVVGEFVVHNVVTDVTPWVDTLFFTMEALGLVIGFLSPFLFGIFLPLTE